jgi:adenylate kinase
MIIFLGVTGSGKSLQGKLLADEFGYAWISTGDILRALITGERRRDMLSGKLINDKEMIRIVGKFFELIDLKQQLILDGFPRSIAQTDWLIQQTRAGAFELTAIIQFDVSEAVVHDRLTKRCRADDTEESINKRFEEYNFVTMPIIEHFQSEGYKVIKIDADKDSQTIHQNVVAALGYITGKT